MQKPSKTGQFRPDLPWHDLPIALPDEFPVSCSGLFVQSDKPITCLHRHDVPEIGYCHRGCGIWIVGPKIMPYGTGDVVVITEDETHLAQSAPGTSSEWTWLYFDPLRLFTPAGVFTPTPDLSTLQGTSFVNVLPRPAHPRVNDLVCGIIEECRENALNRRDVIRGMLFALAALLSRIAPPINSLVSRRGKTYYRSDQARIAKAVEYVLAHFSEKLDIDKLAALCAMSQTTFRRVFRRAQGKSAQEYLNTVRLSMALLELESTDRTISGIAIRNGFATLSAFNRMFRKSYGGTPRAWRQRKQ